MKKQLSYTWGNLGFPDVKRKPSCKSYLFFRIMFVCAILVMYSLWSGF